MSKSSSNNHFYKFIGRVASTIKNTKKKFKMSEQNSFSIVSTLKIRGSIIRKEFSAVPCNWVKENKLYWPMSNLKANIENPNSEPDISVWKSSKCCVHRKNILNYQEALMWEETFSEINTEDEEKLVFTIFIKSFFFK